MRSRMAVALVLAAALAVAVQAVPMQPTYAQGSSGCIRVQGTPYSFTANPDGSYTLHGAGPLNGLRVGSLGDLNTLGGNFGGTPTSQPVSFNDSQSPGTQSGSGAGHPDQGNPLWSGLAGALVGGIAGGLAGGPVGAAFGVVVGGVIGAGAAAHGAGTCDPPPCYGCNVQPPEPPIYAPDLYLYPTQAERVHVVLDGVVTASRPAYDGGWTVLAHPGGTLSSGGGHLFYDAAAAVHWQTSTGWVVAAAQWRSWIVTELPRLGLNAGETADFLRDWGADMPPAPYYLVAPQPRGLINQAVGLKITPKPDTLYRLWLYVVPLQHPVAVQAPAPTLLVRRGFTVVEWGVTFPDGVVPPCTPEVNCGG